MKLIQSVKPKLSGKSMLAGIALMTLALSMPAYANTVYSQAPIGNNPSNAFVSSYTNGSLQEQWVFDYFIPSQSGTIGNITWQGTAQPAASLYDTTKGFVIAIYDTLPLTDPEVSSTLPIYQAHIAGNANQKANANGLYDFSANLPSNFAMTAGKPYWITIYATDQAPYLRWGWNTGSGGTVGTIADPNCPSATCTVIVGGNYASVGGGHRAFSLNAAPVTVNLSTAEVGLAYSSQLAGVSSSTSLSSSGSVPPGLTLDLVNGTLSGTPTTAGAYSFTVVGSATDDIFNITIASPVAIATTTLPSGAEYAAYSATVKATGGVTPYTGSLTGKLPTGLAFNAKTLRIAGTPAIGTLGSYPVTVNVTDALGAPQAKRNLLLTIGGASCMALNKLTLLNGSGKITALGKNYIKVGTATIYVEPCTKTSFINGATKITVGETATWNGPKVNGLTVATSLTIQP